MTKLEQAISDALTRMVSSGAVKIPAAVAATATDADKNARFKTKDAALKRAFARKGIKEVTLIDRNDMTKPFDVKPFKAWKAEGRVVKKGEHGVRGLFHVSQTEIDTPKAS